MEKDSRKNLLCFFLKKNPTYLLSDPHNYAILFLID